MSQFLLTEELQHIRTKDSPTARAVEKIVKAVNILGAAVGVSPTGGAPETQPISSISVIAADGIFDIAITDNSPVNQSIEYFCEYATDAGFKSSVVVAMGAARNIRVFLGNHTLYWRGYSQNKGSAPSIGVNFGSPTAVVGGGALVGPAIQPSQGSGTGAPAGQPSGFGQKISRQ